MNWKKFIWANLVFIGTEVVVSLGTLAVGLAIQNTEILQGIMLSQILELPVALWVVLVKVYKIRV
jgi:hypothetical protein